MGLVKSTTAEDGVVLAEGGSPAVEQPPLFVGREPQHFADGDVRQVQLRQPLEGVVEGEGDEMEVGELVGEDGERAGHDVDRLRLAVAEVDQVPARGQLADRGHHFEERGLGNGGERPADVRGERGAAQSKFFGGREHGRSRKGAGAPRRGRNCTAPNCPAASA
jgi:hypothetical protein